MSILFLNILTLLAPTQSADNLFHSFTVLCENENCLISSQHCFFANVTPCPLILLSSLTEKTYFCQSMNIRVIYKFKVCVHATGRYRQHTLIVYLFDATGEEQEKTDDVEETAVENKEE